MTIIRKKPKAFLAKMLLMGIFFIFLYSNTEAQRRGGKPAAHPPASRQARPAPQHNSRPATTRPNNSQPRPNASKPAINNGNKNNNKANKNISAGNRNNVGNKVNVDNSRKNVNVNVDRSKTINVNNKHNTRVIVNTRPYPRPPYVYGGRRFYAYHPYRYHPYHPYYWGPVWHPWGFFVATLATTAIIISIQNQQYHYDQGVYYMASNGGYTVVQAPIGATITTLPPNSQTVVVNETTNNYYYGGTYYEKSDKGFTVVAPTAGTVVENLPEGGKEVTMGDQKYVKVGETYYQPINQDGKDMYEVVNVEEEK